MNNLSRSLNTARNRSLKRLGFIGFAFFFAKGLVWLALAYFAHGII